jgi:GH15 family glucan-1,4-alpha-glucosidase
MLGLSVPPGGPGIHPTWTSSAKDLVTTALGTGRVWVTLGHGILNEIYWPTTGTPQTRDLGFIVATPNGWFEVKRINRYTVSTPAPSVHCRTWFTKAKTISSSWRFWPIRYEMSFRSPIGLLVKI